MLLAGCCCMIKFKTIFKKSKNGLPISVSSKRSTSNYGFLNFVKKQQSSVPTTQGIIIALKIPLEIILDVIINIIFRL
jgi:hypothetical protein